MAKTNSPKFLVEVLGVTTPRTPEETIIWRPVRCAEHYWQGENCSCPPGPQVRALVCPEFEIFYGGSRGGMKTETGRAWLLKGNPGEPVNHLPLCDLVQNRGSCNCGAAVNVSYVNHPRYRALVLRKNLIDLQDWIDRARQMYTPLGAKFTDRPPVIEFPSGAKIILGHMGDEDAYEKYQGQEFHRMVIEELTQIPSELLYLRILASCRSTFKCKKQCKPNYCRCGVMREQIFITANPGGVGTAWVKARFIKPRQADGTIARPNTTFVDEITNLPRIFIPARVTDNPFLMRDPQYVSQLRALPEAQRRAWLDGDWDALSGQVFCTDAETEFLTLDGFKHIDRITAGDLVATRTPDGVLTYAPVRQVVHTYYDGDLLYYNSRAVNFAVTPSHRMLCVPDNGHPLRGNYDFVEAQYLPRCSVHPTACADFVGLPMDTEIEIGAASRREYQTQTCTCSVCGGEYTARGHRLRHRRQTTCSRECSYKFRAATYGKAALAEIPRESEPVPVTKRLRFSINDWMEFLGWYISEGNLDGRTVCIAQSFHKDRVARIERLLTRMGLRHRYDGTRFKICSFVLAEYLRPLGKASDKYIPREFLHYGRLALGCLFEGLFLGDGHKNPQGGWSYYTVSRRLADDVQELCLKLGHTVTLNCRRHANSKHRDGYFLCVAVPRKQGTRVWRSKLQRRHYSGMVGCLTVEPYHTILMRRGGRLLWTGNSHFRPNGPLAGDPPEARHVIDASEYPLMSWWPRTIGMDWGYKHAAVVYWGCYTPSKQIVVYREKIFRETDPDVIGAEIARASAAELYGLDRPMALWLSPECFGHAQDERTVAHQVQQGILGVLGRDAAFLFDPEELGARTGDSMADARKVQDWQHRAGIMLRRARNQRVDGWRWIHSLMRFTQLLVPNKNKFDPNYAEKLLMAGDAGRYFAYLDSFKPKAAEVLPRLLITRDCESLIESIPTAVYKDEEEDVLKTDLLADDCLDSCLVAGTQIQTRRGKVSIEDIVVGDGVLTRKGFKSVIAAGQTSPRVRVFRVEFSNATSLIGTANHPVFVRGAGFVPIGQLRVGDEVLTCKSRRLNLKELFTVDIRKAVMHIYATITGRRAGTEIPNHCMWLFGKPVTEVFRRVAMSIIRTWTLLTTLPRTWGFETPVSTCGSMDGYMQIGCEGSRPSAESTQNCGTLLQPENSGTQFTPESAALARGLRLKRFVSSARLFTDLGMLTLDSVPTTASQPGAEPRSSTGWISSVRVVVSRFVQTVLRVFVSAPVRVAAVRSFGEASVYNLSVSEQPEYFANGILVHNCRYLLMGIKWEEERLPLDIFRARRLEEAAARNPAVLASDSRFWIEDHAEREWRAQTAPRGVSIPRLARASRLVS